MDVKKTAGGGWWTKYEQRVGLPFCLLLAVRLGESRNQASLKSVGMGRVTWGLIYEHQGMGV